MLLKAEAEDRAWLENLIYPLLEEHQYDYCYTFHNLDIIAVRQPFAFSGPLPVPAGVTMDEKTGQLALLIYWPIASRLTMDARIELMQHEAGHIINGHFSSYGRSIAEVFGHRITNMAMDIYINDRTSHECLDAEGLPGVYREQFGFPPKLSSYEYARLLQKEADAGRLPEEKQPQQLIVVPCGGGGAPGSCDVKDPQAGTAGAPGDDFTGKGTIRLSEVFDINDANDAAQADARVREIITNVTTALETSKKAWGRGFGGADQEQFIKAIDRDAEVPWHYYIKAMESRFRADRVIPTRRRPSRRHPLHQGRVRRYGLEVAFVIDTSGSMGPDQLRLVDPELKGLHARKAHIMVYHCDAAVAKIEAYNPYEPLEKFHGRGGTEYSDAFLKMREQYPPPGFVIVYTDGWGGIEGYKQTVIEERGQHWWDDYTNVRQTHSPDGIETLWVIPEGCMKPDDFKNSVAPWGDVVTVPTVANELQDE